MKMMKYILLTATLTPIVTAVITYPVFAFLKIKKELEGLSYVEQLQEMIVKWSLSLILALNLRI
jgi:hypothetical protein